MRSCNFRKLCGHVCTSVCHIVDVEHVGIYKRCPQKCDKIVCEREHRCPKNCHIDEDCGKCTVSVEKIRPQCDHTIQMSCSGNPFEAFCQKPCEKNRSCGHKCKGMCSVLCDETVCNELIEAESPCGHKVQINCSDASDEAKLLNACPEPCQVELKCGHLCKGSCGRCKYGRLHIR